MKCIRYAKEPDSQTNKILNYYYYCYYYCPFLCRCINSPAYLTVEIQKVIWGTTSQVLPINTLKAEKAQKHYILSSFLQKFLTVLYLMLCLPYPRELAIAGSPGRQIFVFQFHLFSYAVLHFTFHYLKK